MAVEITFPRVDMDMTSGRVSAWLVQEGQSVRKGDPLFEIETDKAAMEIESPATGILRGITASKGAEVQVGLAIGWIVSEGESWIDPATAENASIPSSSPEPSLEEVSTTLRHSETDVAPETSQARTDAEAKQPTRATPLARREAKRMGIALDTVKGSGPRGRVFCRDLANGVDAQSSNTGTASSDHGVAAKSVAVAEMLAPAETAPTPAPAEVVPPPSAAPRTERLQSGPSQSPSSQPAPIERERRPQRQDVDGQGVYRQWLGLAEGRPVVFLHGFGGDQVSWRPVWAQVGNTHRILALDLPGHGRSAASEAPSFNGLVDAVSSTLRAEGISRLHLVGHSLGGAIALGLVDTAEFDILSLCLIAPAGLGPEIDGAFITGMTSATQEASIKPWLMRLFANADVVSAGFVKSALQGLLRDGVREYQSALAATLFTDGTQTVNVRHVLRQLTMPTKILWGRQDRIIPIRHAYALPASVALHTLDSGHMPQVEEPSVVAALIGELTRAAGH